MGKVTREAYLRGDKSLVIKVKLMAGGVVAAADHKGLSGFQNLGEKEHSQRD